MRVRNPGHLRTCIATVLLTSIFLAGCSDSDDGVDVGDSTDTGSDADSSIAGSDTDSDADTDSNTGSSTAPDAELTGVGLDIGNFRDGALESSEIVDCELSDGTETQCYEIVTTGTEKTSDIIGPFCPENFDTTVDNAGIWLDGGTLYEADGEFFTGLANLYSDTYPPAANWDFADENGDLQVVTTQAGCEAAAQPDVEPEFQSHCVQCLLENQDPAILSQTFLIPVSPIEADVIGELSADAGVSVNGFQIAAQAPVEDILGNWTIAAFDDCGGHINPNEGYHYHSATGRTGCNSEDTSVEADGHTIIGYAMDGYAIYSGLDESSDEINALDDCGGTTDDIRGYHYHASSPEANEHIGCFHGKTVATAEGGGDGPPGGGDRPDGEPPEGAPPAQ